MKPKNQTKKKMPSEADMGPMNGYDPNLGVGKAGMKQMMKPMMAPPNVVPDTQRQKELRKRFA